MFVEVCLHRDMFDISINFSFVYIFVSIVVGFLYAIFLYRNENTINPEWLKKFLFSLRFIFVTFLCFLLLSPIVNFYEREDEKPILIIAQDVSSSIKEYNIYNDLSALSDKAKQYFSVYSFNFDSELKQGFSDSTLGSQTNYSNLLDEIESKFINRNVTALVIASDGIYNEGENPIYKINSTDIPIYTIALGDTIQQKDILIKSVNYNEIAFLGNEFPIEVLVSSFNCDSENIEFKLTNGSSILYKQNISIDKNDYHLRIPINVLAKQKGLQKYILNVTALNSEKNKVNNTYEIYIDVIDSKHNILLLSDNTHPDIAAYTSVLEKNKYYSVDHKKLEGFNQNFLKYNLIVLFGIPGDSYAGVLKEIIDSDIPLLYFLNTSTNIPYFNNFFKGMEIKDKNIQQESTIIRNKNFSLFKISPDLERFILELPPIFTPFGEYKLSSSSEILLNQKIGKIETNKPILLFESSRNKKLGVFIGEGIWRWRLKEYAENSNSKSFDELFSKATQFLLLKEDKSHFRLSYQHKINANSPIIISAEFYNESYELTTNNEIFLNIYDSDGIEFPFIFSKLDDSYTLNLGELPIGDYTFSAKVEGKEYFKEGSFSVIPYQVEMLQTLANHQLLYNLSFQSGGKMFYPSEIDDLFLAIDNSERKRTITHIKEKAQEIINIEWILFSLLLFICLEWSIRRYNSLL